MKLRILRQQSVLDYSGRPNIITRVLPGQRRFHYKGGVPETYSVEDSTRHCGLGRWSKEGKDSGLQKLEKAKKQFLPRTFDL